MPKYRLYLVRFPGLRCAIISAKNVLDLVNIIDAVEDPSDCFYQEYVGPVRIDIDLNVQHPVVVENGTELVDTTHIDENTDLVERDLAVYMPSDCEMGIEMAQCIREEAFPVYEGVRTELAETEELFDPPKEKEEALRLMLNDAAKAELLAEDSKIPGPPWKSLANAVEIWYKQFG